MTVGRPRKDEVTQALAAEGQAGFQRIKLLMIKCEADIHHATIITVWRDMHKKELGRTLSLHL